MAIPKIEIGPLRRGQINDVGLFLGFAPTLSDHGRDLVEPQFTGCKQTSVARNQAAIFVDEHRIGPAPLADRGSNLRDLFVRVRAGVARIGRDLLYRPELAALGRPVLNHMIS